MHDDFIITFLRHNNSYRNRLINLSKVKANLCFLFEISLMRNYVKTIARKRIESQFMLFLASMENNILFLAELSLQGFCQRGWPSG